MKVPSPVITYWEAHGLDVAQMTRVRERCCTDLAFLAKCLGYAKFSDGVHREVFDFFLKKDPSQDFEAYALKDLETHDRLLLLPRSGYKSTADIVDSVQYCICWPDITILLITGKDDLGRDFIGELKGHFERQDCGDPKLINAEASLFQLAFPEHCIDGEGPKDSFTTPARQNPNIKEATFQFGGVETAMSGFHFDVIKFDDAITNENSRIATRLQSIKNQIAMHRKMLHPHGYADFIGTWYSPSDYYGAMIRAEEENRTLIWDRGRADSRDTESKKRLTKILLRPAMWPKEAKDIQIDGELNPEDWELWFPEKMTFAWLMKERGLNREVFASQMMNNPALSTKVKFTRERLISCTKPFTQMPDIQNGGGIIVQAWDTTYRDRVTNDFTVGSTALILRGRYYILDIVRGHFNEYELPRVMANAAFKWKPARIAVEELNGIHWLLREIYREQDTLGFRRFIELAEIKNVKNRKQLLAAPLAKAILEDRFIFSNAIPRLDDVYNELEGFENGAQNDDIVDSLALIVNHFGMIPEASPLAMQEIDEAKYQREQRAEYERIHGIGKFATLINRAEDVPVTSLPLSVTYSPMQEF